MPAGPAATASLRTAIPAEATGVEVRLSNAAVVSQPSPAAGLVLIVGPTATCSGPLAAHDWMSLLDWLSPPAGGFGAFGFDSIAHPVTDIAPLAGANGVPLVEDIAKATLMPSSGFIEPNVAFAQTRRLTRVRRALALRRRARNVTVTVPARRTMTVLLAAGTVAKAGLSLVDPVRRVHTLARPGSGVTFVQRDTYTLVKVARPAKGTWTVKVSAARAVAARLRVTFARPTPVS